MSKQIRLKWRPGYHAEWRGPHGLFVHEANKVCFDHTYLVLIPTPILILAPIPVLISVLVLLSILVLILLIFPVPVLLPTLTLLPILILIY